MIWHVLQKVVDCYFEPLPRLSYIYWPIYFNHQSLGYSRKKNGDWGHTFLKTPWNFSFFYFTPGNSRQNKAPPLEIPQIFARSLGNFIQGQKPRRSLEIPHYVFFVTLGNSCSFLTNPGNSTCYFFDTPRNSTCYFFNTPGNSIQYFFDTPENSISSTPPAPRSCFVFLE